VTWIFRKKKSEKLDFRKACHTRNVMQKWLICSIKAHVAFLVLILQTAWLKKAAELVKEGKIQTVKVCDFGIHQTHTL